jgi:hypothetical protein
MPPFPFVLSIKFLEYPNYKGSRHQRLELRLVSQPGFPNCARQFDRPPIKHRDRLRKRRFVTAGASKETEIVMRWLLSFIWMRRHCPFFCVSPVIPASGHFYAYPLETAAHRFS